MSLSAINWWGVLVCVVFSMISGSVWYNPRTFFITWWRAIGMTEADQPAASPVMWVLTILSSVVQSIFMAALVPALGAVSLLSGAAIGFMVWLGIVAPTSLVNKLFADRLSAWPIEMGNHIINLVVFGAIFGAWH
jgi:hypothetical protein